MKKCPYCAEEIQDEAIKCRYCFSDLTKPPEVAVTQTPPHATTPSPASTQHPAAAPSASSSSPSSSPTPSGLWASTPGSSPVADAGQIRYTHSGHRYVLGYGGDFFGIWDRQSPSVPAERYPRDDEGWRQAWLRFAGLEPNHVAVDQTGQPAAAGATAATSPGGGPESGDTDVVQYTHSGQRYLLGYGRTFFGIWDRQSPQAPMERFSRDDTGWATAWARYTQLETHFTEVGLGSSGSPGRT